MSELTISALITIISLVIIFTLLIVIYVIIDKSRELKSKYNYSLGMIDNLRNELRMEKNVTEYYKKGLK